MGIVHLVMERPGLERTVHARDFADPLGALASEHSYLRRVMVGLGRLAADLHAANRQELAGAVLDYLSLDLKWLLSDQEDVLAALERTGARRHSVSEADHAIRSEHAAMRRLLPHVLNGLQWVSLRGLPEDPRGFSMAALVFCEFLKLHTDYEDEVLLPLAERILGPAELEDIGIDMALRRGMTAL